MSTIPEWFWEAVKSPRVITPRLTTLICIICLGMRQTDEGFYSSTGTMLTRIGGTLLRPLFCDQYHPIAMDMSGMGDSDHKSRTQQGSTLTKLSR